MAAVGRTVLPWIALALVTAVVAVPALGHDFRDNPPVGDQVAHTFLALSIAYDSHTLNFDGQDSGRWAALGWADVPTPRSLFFQRYGDGWAASKPYGYPLVLAPFIAVFGVAWGVALGNTLLLLVLVVGSALLAARRFDAITAALAVAAFYLFSLIPAYAYPVHTELYLAVLTLGAFGGAYMYRRSGRLPWALLSLAAMSVGVSEKASFLLLYAPLALVLLLDRLRDKRALAIMLATGVAVFVVAVVPYVIYSDGDTFTPYAGERYQVSVAPDSRPPWDGGVEDTDYYAAAADEGGIAENAVSGRIDDRFASALYYFVGRYTGVIVTVPLALLLLGAVLWRVRAADRWTVAALIGVLAYVVFYVIVFPKNYYGGGQSVGDRYFIQIAPAVFVLALLSPLRARAMRWLSVAGMALAVVLSGQHLVDQDRSFVEYTRSSAVQRLLPFESNQDYADTYPR